MEDALNKAKEKSTAVQSETVTPEVVDTLKRSLEVQVSTDLLYCATLPETGFV